MMTSGDSTASTILIADDDVDQLQIRAMLLCQQGWTCFCAAEAQTAVSIARREKPSCALVDLRFPTEAEGLALIAQLQSITPSPSIVVLTGRSDRSLGRIPELARVAAVLEKGSPSAPMLALLRRLANERPA